MIGRGAYIPASGTSCSGGFWSYGGGCIPCSLNPSQCGSPAVMPTPAPRVTTTTTIAPSRSCSPGYFYYLADRGSGCAVCPSVWSASIPFPSECSGYTRRKSVPTTTTTTSPPPPATLPPCPSGVVRYGCIPTTTTTPQPTTTVAPQLSPMQKEKAKQAFIAAVLALCRVVRLTGRTTGIANIDNGRWCPSVGVAEDRTSDSTSIPSSATTTTSSVAPSRTAISSLASDHTKHSKLSLQQPNLASQANQFDLTFHPLIDHYSLRQINFLEELKDAFDLAGEFSIEVWEELKNLASGTVTLIVDGAEFVFDLASEEMERWGENEVAKSRAWLAGIEHPVIVAVNCLAYSNLPPRIVGWVVGTLCTAYTVARFFLLEGGSIVHNGGGL